METVPSLTTVPLKHLSLSSSNVRRSNRDEDIEGLAADILERGLDQNLIVVPGDGKSFEVVAGGRRYLALRRLQAARRIAAGFEVPVKVVEPVDARATSLAENIQRVAMNPADEVAAFAEIVAEHVAEPDPVAYCARRTGRSRDVVEQRLRLAGLQPQILEALRSGTIGLTVATAYASVADHAAQLAVFRAEEAREFGTRHRASSVRDTLLGRTLDADCPLARYVGLDVYRAAGGRIDRDLFMGQAAGDRLLDRGVLDELAREKAEADLARAVQRDGFGDGLLTRSLTALPIWPTLPKGYEVGGRVADPSTMTTLPAHVVRPTAIGVYTLQGAGLAPIGWLVPIAVAAPKSAPAPSSPDRREDVTPVFAPTGTVVPFSRPGDRLRDEALRRSAARIAATHVIQDTSFANAIADAFVIPIAADFIPPVTTAIGDDDTFLVAVQIRVSRADLDAAMGEAAEQLETDDQVAGARGEAIDA